MGECVEEVKARLWGILTAAWRFWPLVHCVTYGLIPAQHRILWVNCVDLVWSSILSGMASGGEEDAESGVAGAGAEVGAGEGLGVEVGEGAAMAAMMMIVLEEEGREGGWEEGEMEQTQAAMMAIEAARRELDETRAAAARSLLRA